MMGWLDRIKRQARRRTVERRRHERYPTLEHLSCPLGEPQDLSVSGMKLLCTGRPPFRRGELVTFTIRAGGECLAVTGKVVRLNRCGFRQFDVGVAFHNLKPAHQRMLKALAQFGFAGAPSMSDCDAPRERPHRLRVSTPLIDYYQTLGVDRFATADKLRAAFHRQAMRYHPDHNRSGDAARMFQQVHEAYEVLKDSARRREYDRQLARAGDE